MQAVLRRLGPQRSVGAHAASSTAKPSPPAIPCAENAKAGRAVVLTTHSMEEADILGDQIAIMARGRWAGLRCVPLRLASAGRCGAGWPLGGGRRALRLQCA